jgi:hypothetical protein
LRGAVTGCRIIDESCKRFDGAAGSGATHFRAATRTALCGGDHACSSAVLYGVSARMRLCFVCGSDRPCSHREDELLTARQREEISTRSTANPQKPEKPNRLNGISKQQHAMLYSANVHGQLKTLLGKAVEACEKPAIPTEPRRIPQISDMSHVDGMLVRPKKLS